MLVQDKTIEVDDTRLLQNELEIERILCSHFSWEKTHKNIAVVKGGELFSAVMSESFFDVLSLPASGVRYH